MQTSTSKVFVCETYQATCRRTTMATLRCETEMRFIALLASILATLALVEVGGSRILFVTLYGSRSHVRAVVPAMQALNARGHEVTYLTLYEPEQPVATGINVLPLEKVKNFVDSKQINYFTAVDASGVDVARWLADIGIGVCDAFMRDPNFHQVVADNHSRYDAVVMDPSFSECALVLVWLLGSPPLVYYCTTVLYSWTAMALDIPSPFAYVPLYFSPFTDEMSFWERYSNTLTTIAFLAYRNYYLIPMTEKIIHKDYPTAPALLNLVSNASFVFANSHSPSVDLSRPLAPFFVEVGGAQCRPAEPLPKGLEDFVTGAGDDGFIYFSAGSYVRGADMDPKKAQAFLNAFGRLKQRVIWKFEEDVPDVPSNVKIVKWLPQQDILGHQKLKLFITQGGQLSMHEAVYHGVPILGLPIFAEHFSTCSNYKRKGIAEILDYAHLNEEVIYTSIMKVISDAKYKDNCLIYSRLFRDRPMAAVDEVVYWIEYVIRHDGGHHLRFGTDHLNFFQYFLLDGIAVVFVTLFVVFYVPFKVIKMLFVGLYRLTFACRKRKGATIQYKKLK